MLTIQDWRVLEDDYLVRCLRLVDVRSPDLNRGLAKTNRRPSTWENLFESESLAVHTNYDTLDRYIRE